jgi:diketogulonate reductase-like aldo/keto reductase
METTNKSCKCKHSDWLCDFCLENNILIIGYSPLDQDYIADGNIKKYFQGWN